FQLPVLAGRSFEADDPGSTAPTVVVNRAFVRDVLGGADPRGRRLRYTQGFRSGGVMRVPNGVDMERWYEIVGVVGDLPPNALEPDATVARVYHPLPPGSAYPLTLSVHTRGAPAAFAPRLRELAAAVDPG